MKQTPVQGFWMQESYTQTNGRARSSQTTHDPSPQWLDSREPWPTRHPWLGSPELVHAPPIVRWLELLLQPPESNSLRCASRKAYCRNHNTMPGPAVRPDPDERQLNICSRQQRSSLHGCVFARMCVRARVCVCVCARACACVLLLERGGTSDAACAASAHVHGSRHSRCSWHCFSRSS